MTINMPADVLVGVLGALVILVGSFGPWVDTIFASVSGIKGDGQITAVLAVIALLVAFRSANRPSGRKRVALVVTALLAGATAGYDLANINEKTKEITIGGTQVASAGWGLYVIIGGAVLLIAAAVKSRSSS